MPERLIRLFKYKDTIAAESVLNPELEASVRSWGQNDIDALVRQIAFNATTSLQNFTALGDTEVCPHCIKHRSRCKKCEFAKIHGICTSTGSTYDRCARQRETMNMYEGIDPEEVLLCLKD